MNKQIISSLCDMKSKPNLNSFLETQLLFGEQVSILKKRKIGFIVRLKMMII